MDDGSTDRLPFPSSEAWAERRPGLVTVVTKSNGGQGSARNPGTRARDRGVGHIHRSGRHDQPRLLHRPSTRFSTAHPDVEVLSFHPLSHYEATNQLVDDHPRRWQFEHGPRAVDLDREPEVFTGGAPVGAFRLDRIRAIGLRFDPRIRPTFEDGHFAMVYVLSLDRPIIGVVPGARYLYRKRADGTSTLQQSWRDPGRLTDVVEFGHLDILERSRRPDGKVPPWVQHLLVYELSWYLAVDGRVSSIVRVPPETFVRFHELMERILPQLDPKIIAAHRIRKMSSIWVDILAHGYRAEPWHGDRAARTRVDRAMGLQRIAYRYIGPPPRERFLVDGAEVTPAFGKVMTHLFFGRVVMLERIAWLPLGEVRVELDGRAVRLIDGWPAGRYRGRPTSKLAFIPYYARRIGPTLARSVMSRVSRWGSSPSACRSGRSPDCRPTGPATGTPGSSSTGSTTRTTTANASSSTCGPSARTSTPGSRSRRGRPTGGDCAPPGARSSRPARGRGSCSCSTARGSCPRTRTWPCSGPPGDAVPAAGDLADRLPPARRHEGRPLALVQPEGVRRVRGQHERRARLGRRRRDAVRVHPQGGAPDRPAEVRPPAHPGPARPPADRDLIIVAPTWRTQLTIPLEIGSGRGRSTTPSGHRGTFRSWMGLLTDDRLPRPPARRVGGSRSCRIPTSSRSCRRSIFRRIEALTFEGNDVQAIYARCALLVTDYSSVAFNVAYLDGPVVYYQFDREVEAESSISAGPATSTTSGTGSARCATAPTA